MSPTEAQPLDADRALVESVLARRAGAFEHLVREHQRLCWHIINRMVRHRDDTEELCQETFLRVHLRLHQYRFESPLRSWIGQVAYSIAVRYLQRKRIPTVEALDDEFDPLETLSDGLDLEAASADAEVAQVLHSEIESLPALPRTVLSLYHLDELSIAEIAGITGLAEGSIKSHLFRSRTRLRKRLETRLGVTA